MSDETIARAAVKQWKDTIQKMHDAVHRALEIEGKPQTNLLSSAQELLAEIQEAKRIAKIACNKAIKHAPELEFELRPKDSEPGTLWADAIALSRIKYGKYDKKTYANVIKKALTDAMKKTEAYTSDAAPQQNKMLVQIYTVKQLAELWQSGIQVPLYQRKFIVSDSWQKDLIQSAISGSPIGLPTLFKDKNCLMVGDGQQRMTTLVNAWKNPPKWMTTEEVALLGNYQVTLTLLSDHEDNPLPIKKQQAIFCNMQKSNKLSLGERLPSMLGLYWASCAAAGVTTPDLAGCLTGLKNDRNQWREVWAFAQATAFGEWGNYKTLEPYITDSVCDSDSEEQCQEQYEIMSSILPVAYALGKTAFTVKATNRQGKEVEAFNKPLAASLLGILTRIVSESDEAVTFTPEAIREAINTLKKDESFKESILFVDGSDIKPTNAEGFMKRNKALYAAIVATI